MSAVTALLKKRKWYWKNTFRIFQQQSTFKVIFISCFVIFFETGLCWLFVDSFNFLDSFGGMGAMIISRLFAFFFLGMGIMLSLSSIVTTYATIFRSEEIPFLLTNPFSMTEIITYKFLESTKLSSWAFFFIIIPFVGSYAWHQQLSPTFALWTVLFSIPFLFVCSGIGTIIIFLFMRFFPSKTIIRTVIGLSGIIACVLLLFFFHKAESVTSEVNFKITRIVPGLKLASNALLPSWWISEGIVALTRGNWTRGFMLLGTLLSTAAVLFITIDLLGQFIFYDCWQMIGARHNEGQRSLVILKRLNGILRFIPNDVRGMIIKDIRIFFRDPMQWSQALVFFGLLGIYFANLRSFNYQEILPAQWLNTISFINVFSVSAVMTSLGSRFVYPQLSLEGHGFWLIGLSPATTKRIILTKFFTSLTALLTASVSLILLSSSMLNSPYAIKVTAVSLACAISFAISALSTGLGAIFLDLDERNPAAIVSGFGGTLNLVLCLCFMLAAIMPPALIFHVDSMIHFPANEFTNLMIVSCAWLIIITVLSTVIPLRIGINAMNRRDF